MAAGAHYPSPTPIEAYGNGGFRFARLSHRGSLLVLPSGVYGWEAGTVSTLSAADFDPVFAEAEAVEFLLLGTGTRLVRPAKAIYEAFALAGVGLEVMDTGAACRTLNVLLDEARAVAAALIAVP